MTTIINSVTGYSGGMSWVNNSSNPITWTNDASGVITWSYSIPTYSYSGITASPISTIINTSQSSNAALLSWTNLLSGSITWFNQYSIQIPWFYAIPYSYGIYGNTATLVQVISSTPASLSWVGYPASVVNVINSYTSSTIKSIAWSNQSGSTILWTNSTSNPINWQYISNSSYQWIGTTANTAASVNSVSNGITWSGTTSNTLFTINSYIASTSVSLPWSNQSGGSISWTNSSSGTIAWQYLLSYTYKWSGIQSVIPFWIQSFVGYYEYSGIDAAIQNPVLINENVSIFSWSGVLVKVIILPTSISTLGGGGLNGDLSIFTNARYDDKNEFNDFLLANSLSHSVYANKFLQAGKNIHSYPISTMNDENDWLGMHNEIHQNEFAILGLQNMVNLSDIDLNDQEAYSDWMQQHALIHLYINQVLGIKT